MAKLHSLIKFKRHELDERRRILSELNKELEALFQKKHMLLDNLAREKNLAAVDLESARNFPFYLKRVMAEQDMLDGQISDKIQEVQAATLVVQEAYLEAKKLELAQEKRDQEEADTIAKKESDMLDEIGLETFRRKGEEGLA